MDIDALIWLLIPFLFIVVWVVLARVRPSVLKRSRKSIAVGIVVIALVIVYTIWNLFFRQ